MKSDWFKEERALPKEDQEEAKEATRKAIKSSTILINRLNRILNERVEETYRQEEDFSKPDWERETIANASRRKTLREILTLIELK